MRAVLSPFHNSGVNIHRDSRSEGDRIVKPIECFATMIPPRFQFRIHRLNFVIWIAAGPSTMRWHPNLLAFVFSENTIAYSHPPAHSIRARDLVKNGSDRPR